MKIALFVPDLRGGGVERVRLLLAREFIALGHSVELVLLQRHGDLLDQVPPEVRIVDLQQDRIRGALFPLARYLREERPDAILASMWPLTTLAVVASWLARFRGRVIVSEHTALTKSPVGQGVSGLALRLSMRWVNGRADKVVGVSNGVVADLHKLGLPRDAGCTIYNPVEISKSVELPSEWHDHPWATRPRCERLLAVGSLKTPKNYPLLLDAIKTISENGADVSLLILGEGQLLSELEKKRDEYGLRDRVHFGGFVSDPGPFYRAAGCFVLSSAWEGFGNVIVEALAAGVPVVSTDCVAGPAEILDYGRFGKLAAVGDLPGLAQAIEYSLRDSVNPCDLMARAEEFAPPVIAQQYLEIINPGGF